jgi:ribosomal protein L11 methyltransferase
LSKKESDELVKMFGGQVSEAKWLTTVDPPLRPPIRIREKLLIVSTAREREDAIGRGERRGILWIPAGMAFGTGEHDTTVTCLRLLADLSLKLPRDAWELLDLGTGSGILAVAGRLLGAKRAEAGDFDPHAVRTAKENIRANEVKGILVKRMDVRRWEPERTWEVVTANLFSGLLIEVAPKIAASIAPGGALIFSGVLREQEPEVVAAFQQCGLKIERIVRKGKWIAGLANRP